MRGTRARIAAGAAFVLIVAIVVAVVLLNQGDRNTTPPPVTVSPSPTVSPTPSTPPTALKPEISGLLDRQGMPAAELRVAVQGFVVDARWADLQPTQSGPIASNNVIDHALAQVRAANAASPGLHMALKVRIYTGVYAPDW